MIKNEEIILLHNNQIADFSISEDENKIAYVYGNLDLPHSVYLSDIKK